MSSNGYATYKTAQTKSDDPRDIEYRLLAQVTGAMIDAKYAKEVKPKIEAVLWNSRVWSALRVDLYDEKNQLPEQLRGSLISLSLWIERETHAIMDGDGDMEALIDINRNIMAGLKPELAQEEVAS